LCGVVGLRECVWGAQRQNLSGHRPDCGDDGENDLVQKGDERWEIARDDATRAKGDLKVGQKVTIHYRMTATTVKSK